MRKHVYLFPGHEEISCHNHPTTRRKKKKILLTQRPVVNHYIYFYIRLQEMIIQKNTGKIREGRFKCVKRKWPQQMLRDIGGFSTFQAEILIFIPQQSSSKFKFLAPSLTVKRFTFFRTRGFVLECHFKSTVFSISRGW